MGQGHYELVTILHRNLQPVGHLVDRDGQLVGDVVALPDYFQRNVQVTAAADEQGQQADQHFAWHSGLNQL